MILLNSMCNKCSEACLKFYQKQVETEQINMLKQSLFLYLQTFPVFLISFLSLAVLKLLKSGHLLYIQWLWLLTEQEHGYYRLVQRSKNMRFQDVRFSQWCWLKIWVFWNAMPCWVVNSYHCFIGAWCLRNVTNVKFSHHHALTLPPRERHLHFSPSFLQVDLLYDILFVLSTGHNLLGVSVRNNFKRTALTRQNTTEYLLLNNRINSPSQDTTALESNTYSNWNISVTGHKCLKVQLCAAKSLPTLPIPLQP